MSMPAQPPPDSWTVTGSTEVTRIDTSGNPVRGRQVSFTTGANGSGTVFIPDNVTDPATMRSLIMAAAGRVDMINSLTSGE